LRSLTGTFFFVLFLKTFKFFIFPLSHCEFEFKLSETVGTSA